MKFKNLWKILKKEIPKKISKNNGLNVFVKNRAKFEGWLKVELCNILLKHTDNITPEKDRIDIVFDKWALELKTSNTNYIHDGVEKKSKPITDNINNIIEDIQKLKNNKDYDKKVVVFIVFPLSKGNQKDWDKHISKIKKEKEFNFQNGTSAILYCGMI